MFLLTQGTTWNIHLPPLPKYYYSLCLTALEMQSQGEGSRAGRMRRHPWVCFICWAIRVIRNISYYFDFLCCLQSHLLHSFLPSPFPLPSSVCQYRVAIRVRSQLNYSQRVRGQKGKANGESVMHKQHDNISQTFQYCNIGTSQLLTRIKKRSAHGCCLSSVPRKHRAEIGVLCAHVERDSQLWHIISEASNCQWIAGRAKVDSK